MTTGIDLYALGNALVDAEYEVDDRFIRDQGIEKGQMTLVDEARLAQLTRALEQRQPKRESGGSAANTAIAVRGFGGSVYYSCKVADDEDGDHFAKGMNRVGIRTTPKDTRSDGKTGRCLIMITPDAERTMTTFLGISERLSAEELDEAALRTARYLYIEGYLASSATGREAAIAARTIAEQHKLVTSITLSDASMVNYFGDELRRMVGNGVDLLFCNEVEALTWCKTDRVDIAAKELKDMARGFAITLGSRGALVHADKHNHEVPGYPVKPIDTNGAGDIFAGACLWGLQQGQPLDYAARFANFAAARLVTCFGARLPFADYADLRARFPGH